MISAVVLTHNDAPTVVRTLKSIGWADEIIIIDDNSSDNTVELSRPYITHAFTRSLAGDFAAQRNFGLSKVRGDWVLFVDSDETVSPALASEIKKRIASSQVSGYRFRRHDVLWGKTLRHGEIGRQRLVRLARRNAGKWTRPVHEVWEVSGPVEEFSHPLIHHPHPDVREFISDVEAYATSNANYLYAQGKRATVWQIAGYPVAKFFVNYFLYGGWRDGIRGAIVAVLMSFHSFLTRAKLYLIAQ